MKKIIYISLIGIITFGCITSCSDDFLEVDPTGSLSSESLATQAGMEASLIATYSVLLGRGAANGNGFFSDASNWFWGSVLGGDANKGTNAGDQSQVNEIQTYSPQTINESIYEKYFTTYEGVARANNTLKLIDASVGIAEDVTTRIAAETRFLRAHYYFDLKKNFNNTPYVDENWDGVEPVGNNTDLWINITADLQYAYDNLPETMSDAGRANKWAAGAYLGKALLFQGNYADAKAIFDDVIASGTTAKGEAYGLNENYADCFRAPTDNSKESVFASQAAAGTGSVYNANPGMVLNFPNGPGEPAQPGGCCGFFQPSNELANSFRTNEAGLPLLNGSYNSSANKLKSDLGLTSEADFTPDEGNLDPRLDHSIGRRGIPYLDWGMHPGFNWVRDQAYGGPYAPKKFIYYKNGDGENDGSSWTPGYTAVNYNIIRFADVLLMAAECEIELGNLDAGKDLINQVRERAKNSAIQIEITETVIEEGDTTEVKKLVDVANYNIELYESFADQVEAQQAVRMERKLELSGEGHRFYDLVRWGVAAEALNAYLAYENDLLSSPFAGATFTANKNEYLPIPQNEIDLLGADVLKQNPGY